MIVSVKITFSRARVTHSIQRVKIRTTMRDSLFNRLLNDYFCSPTFSLTFTSVIILPFLSTAFLTIPFYLLLSNRLICLTPFIYSLSLTPRFDLKWTLSLHLLRHLVLFLLAALYFQANPLSTSTTFSFFIILDSLAT